MIFLIGVQWAQGKDLGAERAQIGDKMVPGDVGEVGTTIFIDLNSHINHFRPTGGVSIN